MGTSNSYGEINPGALDAVPAGFKEAFATVLQRDRFDIYPGTVVTDSIIFAQTVVFHPDATLHIGDSGQQFLGLVGNKVVFQNPAAMSYISVPAAPPMNGSHGTDGHGGNPHGGDGANGSSGAAGEQIPTFVFVAEEISLVNAEELNNLAPLSISAVGSTGGNGGNGGAGGNGANGANGRDGYTHCDTIRDPSDRGKQDEAGPLPSFCFCEEQPTDGGPGGDGGHGGDAGGAGSGGPGGDVYLIGPGPVLQITESFRVFNEGGQPGVDGVPGRRGGGGIGGRAGRPSHRCRAASNGRNGNPGNPGRPDTTAATRGEFGRTIPIRIGSISELRPGGGNKPA